MTRRCFLIAALIPFCGCLLLAAQFADVRADRVTGGGKPSRKSKVVLDYLSIDLRNANAAYLGDIWIAIGGEKKLMLSDVSVEVVRGLGGKEVKGPSRGDGATAYYEAAEMLLLFNGETLVEVDASDNSGNKKLRLGSVSRNSSITLPCTLRQFESVFGECEYVHYSASF